MPIPLEKAQLHYLRNVLRKEAGDKIRIFNGRDGEWIAALDYEGKKAGNAVAESCIKPQTKRTRKTHLYFSPIKKNRMDMLIEKAVELGVTDLHPVIMARSVMRKVNTERVTAQIIEAAEQSERLDLPTLHDVQPFDSALHTLEEGINIYACVEREGDTHILSECDLTGDVAFIIGPEGGFDAQEVSSLKGASGVTSVSLGDTILRAETAAITCLAYTMLLSHGKT